MKNRATQEYTAEFANNFPDLHYNRLGDTGLRVSAAGFGSYRAHVDYQAHHQALEKALLNGINLIDTSSNYGDGGAEQLIGDIVRKLCNSEQLNRRSLVIVTKAGYLQGRVLQASKQRQENGNPHPDLVEYRPNLEHCIHPHFLQEQIDQSLNRLGLKTIDVFLLHNPEYYLRWAKEVDMPLREAREEYYQRLQKAFAYLEDEVADGRIACYGISSNTFPKPSDHYVHTSLRDVLNTAGKVAENHNLKVMQMPFNLLESGAISEKNQNHGEQSTLDIAKENNIAVLTNRPFNAIQHNALFRLADISGSISSKMEETEQSLNTLIREENRFERELLPHFELDRETEAQVKELFATGSYLAMHWQKLGPYDQWISSQSRILVDRINTGMEILTRRPTLSDEQKQWIDHYIHTFNHALDGLTAQFKLMAARQINELKKRLRNIDPDWDDVTAMTHKALRALRSTAGVSSILVGMRHVDYVEDVLAEIRQNVEVRDRLESWQVLEKQLQDFASDEFQS